MPASDVVLDASVAIRAFVDRQEAARTWFVRIERGEVEGVWPELAFVEVAHAITRLIRGARMTRAHGARALSLTLRARVRAERLPLLVVPAFAVADERGISAYDACYVALAERLGAPLVTADRRLAAATANAVLITA
jgi:predicted nucleic acid-binding protein